ncbi:SRPBCC family protein [Conexibacter arvalis]|uniref:SRPBCC family protein n=1 Tax=Conexibacter arvalis TaxID=912552 RepID=A0A840IAE2_9ACTN|nr:SRPBCC family protein [Conexibacter arvalis]MBB4661325.1 hypothetical protein [Conexibacter arvalis]
MIDFTIETEIARPPADVFAYATDPAKLPSWQAGTVSSEVEGGGPVALGARLREVHRAPGGRELRSLVVVAAFDPPRRFDLHVVEGALPVDADLHFAPVRDGSATHLSFHAHGQPTGAMRLMEPLLARRLRRQFDADCATLKRELEGELAAGG